MLNNQDKLWIGLAIGLIVPFVGYAILLSVLEFIDNLESMQWSRLNFDFKPRTIALLAIALNLIPLRMLRKQRGEKNIRGIVFATMIYAALWFYYFGSTIQSS